MDQEQMVKTWTMVGLLSALVVSLSAAAYSQTPLNTYCNAQYGYCVDYPKDWIPGPEASGSRMKNFSSNGSGIKMSIYQEPNRLSQSMRDIIAFNTHAAGYKTDAQKSGANWYAISGSTTLGNNLFYQKSIFKPDNTYVTLYVEYPQAQKPVMEKVIPLLEASFQYK